MEVNCRPWIKGQVKPLGWKAFSDTKLTVTLDNGHVLGKSDVAFEKIQPLAPCKFNRNKNILVKNNKLAREKKRNTSIKMIDSIAAGPWLSRKPLGSSLSKRQKRTSPNVLLRYSYSTSSIDIDHWDNALHGYLGTDFGVIPNSHSFMLDSFLDQPRRQLFHEQSKSGQPSTTQGSSENPCSIKTCRKTRWNSPGYPIVQHIKTKRKPRAF